MPEQLRQNRLKAEVELSGIYNHQWGQYNKNTQYEIIAILEY